MRRFALNEVGTCICSELRKQNTTKRTEASKHNERDITNSTSWSIGISLILPLIRSALLESHFWNLSLGHKTMRSIPRDQEQLRESKQKKESYPHEAGFGLAQGRMKMHLPASFIFQTFKLTIMLHAQASISDRTSFALGHCCMRMVVSA